MHQKVQDILKKINYIEVEIEVQKQILHAIPDSRRQEMEKVILKIARAKEEIAGLRQEIARISPEEHRKIVAIEEAAAAFRKIAAEKSFTLVESMSTNPDCAITLSEGGSTPCLVKARDEEHNWTIITLEGELRQLGADQVSGADASCEDEEA